ncbi:hypothetical protein COU54_00400 [Candidatus Pacearchaeota archaeon CG10_big_fil_rev_8_21_14_0_10_31_24]|nr:MAG: hypothetical protein COU54_00400 [Candidatus Pacearchaeota archaeon CG10_big_fil_rev_8_21_14_0_10_31_24]
MKLEVFEVDSGDSEYRLVGLSKIAETSLEELDLSLEVRICEEGSEISDGVSKKIYNYNIVRGHPSRVNRIDYICSVKI